MRELGDREVKMSVMIMSGKHHKLPTSEDCIFYPCSYQLLSQHVKHKFAEKVMTGN
jgi:hypothetical protein